MAGKGKDAFNGRFTVLLLVVGGKICVYSTVCNNLVILLWLSIFLVELVTF